MADQRAQPQQSDQRQHHAGHGQGEQQAFDAELRTRGRDQHDERARRAADATAIDNGKATTATVNAARTSLRKWSRV